MKRNISVHDLYGLVIFTVLILILAKFIYVVSSVLISIILAFIFSAALDIPVSWMEKKKISRPIGVFACIAVVIGLLSVIITFMVPPAVEQVRILSKDAPEIVRQLDKKAEKLAVKLKIDYSKVKDPKNFGIKTNNVVAGVLGGVTKFGYSTVNFFISGFLVIVFTVYLVSEPRPLIRGILDPWPLDVRVKIRRCMTRIQRAILYWFVGIMMGSFFIFLLTWIALLIIKMPSAFLFAVIAGFMNIIPTLGPILAALPPLLIAILSNPVMVLKILIVYVAVQQLESHLITPMVMQKQLSIHPVVLLFSIFVMGTFFGLVGIFMTAPVVASVGIFYDEFFTKPRRLKRKSFSRSNDSNNIN